MRENNFHTFSAKDTRFANCLGPSTTWTSDDQTCDEASTYGTVEAFAVVIIIKLQRDLTLIGMRQGTFHPLVLFGLDFDS